MYLDDNRIKATFVPLPSTLIYTPSQSKIHEEEASVYISYGLRHCNMQNSHEWHVWIHHKYNLHQNSQSLNVVMWSHITIIGTIVNAVNSLHNCNRSVIDTFLVNNCDKSILETFPIGQCLHHQLSTPKYLRIPHPNHNSAG